MRARLNTLAISGTGQAEQYASHSLVISIRLFKPLNEVYSIAAVGYKFRMMTGTLARRTTGRTVEESA